MPMGAAVGIRAPHADVCETADAFLIDIEVPGVLLENISLRFEPGQLVCEGRRESRSLSCDCRCHAVEIETGLFRRTVALPPEIDGTDISAQLELGVLHIRVPKALRQPISHRIEVR